MRRGAAKLHRSMRITTEEPIAPARYSRFGRNAQGASLSGSASVSISAFPQRTPAISEKGLVQHPQFLIGDHDMLAKGRSFGQGIVVAVQDRAVLPCDGDVEVAEQHMAELNICQRKVIAG